MRRKQLIYILSGIGVFLIVVIILIYRNIFDINIKVEGKKILYIPTGSSYEQVLDTIYSNLNIENRKALDWVAQKKQYPVLIKPGRYVVDSDLSYIGLINMLRSGRQKPVKITFNNVRTLNQIAGKIGKQIETDSSSLINFLSDDTNYSSDGFRKENVIALFIPNTYEMYWNTDARDPKEVAILASIIDDEVVKADEKPRIAGVYLNRLKRGMPLQACPTIKFALNDFTINRVLNKHLTVDSPYNTYIHTGFPPGPIGCPSVEGLEAVLNAEKHDYIFFAAKADFSGYHNFSRTLAEHNRYAAMYQRELNKRRIFK
jgi:UPF0755 protein